MKLIEIIAELTSFHALPYTDKKFLVDETVKEVIKLPSRELLNLQSSFYVLSDDIGRSVRQELVRRKEEEEKPRGTNGVSCSDT